MGGILSREDILGAQDVKTEECPVPEWGGSVLVRGLTGRARDEFEAGLSEMRGKKRIPNIDNFRAKLVARCCVKESGGRLFTDQDAEKLGTKSAAALERVFDVATRLSGMSPEDVEELTEGFGSPSGDGSSSSSPSGSDAQSASYSAAPTATS